MLAVMHACCCFRSAAAAMQHTNLHVPLQSLMMQVYDYFTCNIDVFKGQILAYDPQNFNIGIAKESGLVPLLLAPIWLLFPYLQVSFTDLLHVYTECTETVCWSLSSHCLGL